MDEQMNQGTTPEVPETPAGETSSEENNEAENTGDQPVNEASDPGSAEKTDVYGQAVDGTGYTPESPEVVKYKELFPDVADDAAIGSVISMHNIIVHGDDPAGENIGEIVGMIREKLADKVAEGNADAVNEMAADDKPEESEE